MTALPAASAFTGPSITEGQFKQAITEQRDFLNGLLGADGGPQTALATLKALMNASLAKTAVYTVVAADKGKVIDADGTWTLSLTAAATLGDGFMVSVKNSGSGTITIDPNLSELVNGAATYALTAGNMGILYCTGTEWFFLGGAGANSIGANELNVSGDGTTSQYLRSNADGSFSWDDPSPPTTFGAVGTYALLLSDQADVDTHVGSTEAGSNLLYYTSANLGHGLYADYNGSDVAAIKGYSPSGIGATTARPSGTWRNMGLGYADGVTIQQGSINLWQRIS